MSIQLHSIEHDAHIYANVTVNTRFRIIRDTHYTRAFFTIERISRWNKSLSSLSLK